MTRAADKYKQRLEAGVWLEPTPERKQIVALPAKLDKMKKKRVKRKRNQRDLRGLQPRNLLSFRCPPPQV